MRRRVVAVVVMAEKPLQHDIAPRRAKTAGTLIHFAVAQHDVASAHDTDAALIHEAAIGKIAGEQILKLRTLGMTEEEAEATIIDGFLS